MKLKTPVTGTAIDVPDDRAALYIERGFARVEPKKKAARPKAKKEK